ncbi:hypothetical protein HDU83_004897 [Entophlyctis luteolus]|nr:hypothetical protein HDU83_004897 [Entophlyctis luteolus]
MLRIVLGSYERLLYGLDVTKNNETGSFSVNQTFTYPAHISSIKTVAISPSGKFLATGASDEHVKTGSITDLEFHETGYLFSASEDNMIAIARTSDWEVLKVLKYPDGKPVLVCAGDSKKVALCSVVDAGNLEPVQISLSSRHPSRIKDLCICVTEFDSKVSVLVTCSSDGAIFGWDLARGFSAGDFGDPLFSFDAKVRLTCCKAVFQSGKSAESEEVMETETAVQIQKDDGDDEEGKSSDEKQSSMFKIRQNQKVQISFEDDTKGPEIKNITNSKWQKTKRRVQGKEKILQKMALSKKVAKKPGGDAGAKKFVSKLKKK